MSNDEGSESRDPIGRLRYEIDRLALSVQNFPILFFLVRNLRNLGAGAARLVIPPQYWRRREVEAARKALALADSSLNEPHDFAAKVLFVSIRAWTTHTAWEITIGEALRQRGADVLFFMCGGGLPICEMGWPARERGRPCKFCGPFVKSMLDAGRFSTVSLDDLVSPSERSTILELVTHGPDPVAVASEIAGLDVVPLTEQSLLWFFRSARLPDTPEVRRARVEFLSGATVIALAARRLVQRFHPEVVVMLNGNFFEERVIREIADKNSVRVVTYEVGAQRGSLFFTDGSVPAPDYDISDLWETEGSRALTQEEDELLSKVLQERATGLSTQQHYYREVRSPDGSRDEQSIRLVLFTNVSWDTAITGKQLAFETMFEWITETIHSVAERPDLSLLIRVHPAESRLPGKETKDRVIHFIEENFPVLPSNVRVIPPEEPVDSYALIDAADGVCVFGSTVGLEAAAMGKPVCIVGLRHYRGRGFTVDVSSSEQYRGLFRNLKWLENDPNRTAKARRYAYLFFCRALLPFGLVTERRPSEPVFQFSSVSELAPGSDAVLDVICDGILNRKPFRLPDPAHA